MKTRIGVAFGALVLALVMPTTVAGASGRPEARAADSTGALYCVHNVTNGETACDSSESAAQQRVSDGRETYTVARLYNWVNFNPDGGVYRITASTTCTPEYDNEENIYDLGVGLSDWASSVRTYNDCDVKLYDHPQVEWPFEGPSSTWIHEADHLNEIGDGWNNRASSLRIS